MAGVCTEVTNAWMHFEDSGPGKNWADDNPGEYKKIEDYRMGATMPEPEGIETEFGLGLLALVNAGKYADGTHPK